MQLVQPQPSPITKRAEERQRLSSEDLDAASLRRTQQPGEHEYDQAQRDNHLRPEERDKVAVRADGRRAGLGQFPPEPSDKRCQLS